MLMAENTWAPGGFSALLEDYGADELEFQEGDDLCIDLDTFYNILDEDKDSDPSKSSPEDLSLKSSPQDELAPDVGDHYNLQYQSGYHPVCVMDNATNYPSGLEASGARMMGGSGAYCSKLESTEQMCPPVQACSTNLNDWFPPDPGFFLPERFGLPRFETPGCSTASSFSEGEGNPVLDHRDNIDFDLLQGKAENPFGHLGSQVDSKYASHSTVMENLDGKYGQCDPSRENWLGSLGELENNHYTFMDRPFNEADVSSHILTSTDSTNCHSSEVVNDIGDHRLTMRDDMGAVDTFFADSPPCFLPNASVPEVSVTNYFDVKGPNCTVEDSNFFSPICGNPSSNINIGHVDDKATIEQFSNSRSHFSGKKQGNCQLADYGNMKSSSVELGNQAVSRHPSYSNNDNFPGKDLKQMYTGVSSSLSGKKRVHHAKDEEEDYIVQSKKARHHQEFIGGISGECLKQMYTGVSSSLSGKKHVRHAKVDEEDSIVQSKKARHHQEFIGGISDGSHIDGEYLKQISTGVSLSLSGKKRMLHAKEREDSLVESKKARIHQEFIGGISGGSHIDGGYLNQGLNASGLCFPCAQPSVPRKKQLGCPKDETGSHISKVSPESIQSTSSDSKSHVDDDEPDICILEDISQPARTNPSLVKRKAFDSSQTAWSKQSTVLGKNAVTSQRSSSCIDSLSYTGAPDIGVGGTRLKACDERLIYRAAMKDLYQPRSEASPPDGVLSVPLMRHQRIALSWMVQKETTSLHCLGGILADDQGLGKTISTIALILKEKPPSRTGNVSKCKLETLNLDDDDVGGGIKQESDSTENLNSVEHARGRPAAGTLIVCPTSVLRQWAEELRNKVTREGNLTVLVYHGSSRTKDPYELASVDVVITTYSIVSMEVPKQPLVDKEDDDTKINDDVSGYASGKKSKKHPSSDKKGLKHKKGRDGKLLDIASGPLAKVGWFRVVLDEAQSIKNHRTQVARACWGLRAKRRWCLSGTPIQNAIDDLYSYFRFLRYDPFAVYKSFCSSIKVPITKNPVKGYKKLQAVLKTIMLRRTKGTLLDGEPIINLPPKVIELKKVDFTDEEREFYNQLEIDSRDQFKEYAAAGTVKQNYVNILLMLLRLRQACDHPLLVKGFDSNSLLRSSVEMAKKLPQEKQMSLLNCLEASLAICGICNDPPEDAVVSLCGHVFCNQCICECLAGDDNQCPTTKCKVRLSASSLFSKATLSNCLSGQSLPDSSTDCSGSACMEAEEPCSGGVWYDSSKIKAALKFLQKLGKPQEHTSTNRSVQSSFDGNTCCPEGSSVTDAGDSHTNNLDKKDLAGQKGLKDSIKVVGEKAIVFSQWTKMLDLLEACLKDSNIQYRRLDGTMSVLARDKAVKDFNTLPEVTVMIMSLKAASLGLNMVAACHVVLLDLWWNPTTEDQAIDRAHRIGQTRPVSVLRLTVKDTVEDRILALQQKKRTMVASAFGEDESGGRQTRLTLEDLKYLFMA